MRRLPVLVALIWVCSVFYTGIFLFVGGFLLVRLEVNRTSTCADVLSPGAQVKGDFCLSEPRFRRAVVLIIDALKADFTRYDPENTAPKPFENKLPVLDEMASSHPSHARLYTFRADPPTTTMQRIKGFTTGSLPTFIDVGNNFASNAILEDNLVHQLGQVGKRVVFMGDDTWVSLFPKKFHRSLAFPSFNVKDLHTVDNGILQNIYPTMEGDDWDVLIAHFLGVDHCGHRFGPDHPAMAEKLSQMDGVIRSVIKRLKNDTLLVVMGDHGMTDTGDHGGESQKETDAALFLYSSSPLFPAPGSQVEPEVVPQTDLVPTLALLLGVPIPYSSVGQVLLPLFPQNGSRGVPTGLSQAEALWINVKQVNRFLETYSNMAKDIPPDNLSQLRTDFSNISSQYLAAVHKGHLPSPELVVSMQNYLTAVRETCRASWARFNPFKMAAGLLILGVACMLCYVLSELSHVVIQQGLLKLPILSGLVVGLVVAAGQLFLQGYLELSWCVGAAALSSEVLFLWRTRGVSPKERWSPSGLLTLALLVLFLRCASLLSDSYVIYEGNVVTFLLFTLSVYVPLRLNWDGLLVPLPPPDTQKPPRLLPTVLSSSVVRRQATILLVWLGVLVGSLYLSLSFHNCREEQGTCQPSPFLSPLSRVQNNQLRNLHYVLSVGSLALSGYLLHRWLRHYGNLNCISATVFSACFLVPLACVCMGLHWAVSATPEDTFRNLSELIGLAQVFLPRATFCLLGLGLLLLWVDPMTVFLKLRTPLNSRGMSLPPPKYRASTGISPQAELHHLIPQLYQRIRHSLEDGATESGETDSRPAVEAYGLGTVYSAPLVLLCGLLGLVLLLLHPEGMALAFLLLLLEAGAMLHIHACSANLSSLHKHSNGFSVPWAPVVSWSLAAAQFFHATGHLPTFPSIQWGAAFVGFPQGHTGTALPASLVTLNTFSSHIIFAVGCPLLLFWPLVCEVRGTRPTCSAGVEESEDAVMEMRLRENPQKFSSGLLELAARYLFVNGAQVFASVCAAAILRRHLMVWKVFAPKLMFEASGFIVGSVFLILGVAMVMRVDISVGGLFKKLLPQNSR
ncbi:GPI ethanolamine phosphate transferase 3-like [Sinocyclocheilus anshuiensis]|uniref:GPI ethanolamine phosphate transferase 3, catalytic subunit n=1 Tax=Sinocyclocheilus anshuiensis TaxID=1608454 RepID=A0A671TD62_9TELE|nr:PREDICTED: GPI ethanolamine phosphate transferase 3-like [Sinocyclocheilus anshuiensis]